MRKLVARCCRPLRGITRIVYSALFEKPELGKGWLEADQIATNAAMLRNLMDAVEPGNTGLRHVPLLQGTKAYFPSRHRHMLVPGKESAPRHIHPILDWAQEDLIGDRQARAAQGIHHLPARALVGFALGSAMNMLSAVGAYAAISRELGVPLIWPGAGARYTEATDVRILACVMRWAADAEAATNRTFNVTNGDDFLRQDLFPLVAKRFGMEMGAPHLMSLAVLMADKGAVWQRIAEKDQLAPWSLDQLIGGSWGFADFAFARPGQAGIDLLDHRHPSGRLRRLHRQCRNARLVAGRAAAPPHPARIGPAPWPHRVRSIVLPTSPGC